MAEKYRDRLERMRKKASRFRWQGDTDTGMYHSTANSLIITNSLGVGTASISTMGKIALTWKRPQKMTF